MNKMLNLVNFNLKVYKKNLMIWFLVIFGVMFIYMILFPYITEIAYAELEAMPNELIELFGISDYTNLDNFITYFEMIYGMVIIAISIFATNFSSTLIGDEELNKTMNFMVNQNISRKELYLSKCCSAIIGILIIISSAIISSFLCGFINGGETFIFINFIKSALVISIIPLFLSSFALLLSGINAKISKGTSLGITFLLYMLGYLGTLIDKDIIQNISPFLVMNYGNENYMIYAILYFLIFIIFTVIGYKFYKKRDLDI